MGWWAELGRMKPLAHQQHFHTTEHGGRYVVGMYQRSSREQNLQIIFKSKMLKCELLCNTKCRTVISGLDRNAKQWTAEMDCQQERQDTEVEMLKEKNL